MNKIEDDEITDETLTDAEIKALADRMSYIPFTSSLPQYDPVALWKLTISGKACSYIMLPSSSFLRGRLLRNTCSVCSTRDLWP